MQSKNVAVSFNFKMKLGSSSIKKSVLGEILLYVTAVDYRDREYNDPEELLCAIIYEVFQQNSIFWLWKYISYISLRKIRVLNWKFKNRKWSPCCDFCNESTNQFEISPFGSVILQLTHKMKILLGWSCGLTSYFHAWICSGSS